MCMSHLFRVVHNDCLIVLTTGGFDRVKMLSEVMLMRRVSSHAMCI